MAIQTCLGATMACTFGLAPSTLIPTPKTVITSQMMAANILDHVSLTNIPPFAMCICPGNPAFVAATTAALGVPTPVPCLPVTPGPWLTGSPTVMLANAPALNNTSTLQCIWGGTITFTNPGQATQVIP